MVDDFKKKLMGVAFFPEQEWRDSSGLEFFTDSAGENQFGCRPFFQGHWVFLL